MIYIVAGGRDFSDRDRAFDVLSKHVSRLDYIISGMARGADSLGAEFAELMMPDGHLLKRPADWDKYGKSAGYRRNHQMALEADVLIAFWDGRSKGTKNMIEEAHKAGLEIHIYRY